MTPADPLPRAEGWPDREWPVAGNRGDDAARELARSLQHKRAAARELDTARFAMWLFLVAEVMLFAAVVGALIAVRPRLVGWPPAAAVAGRTLAAVNCGLLVASVVVLEVGARALRRSARRALTAAIAVAFVLGTLFLGVQYVEYERIWTAGTTLTSSAEGSYFFFIAGGHGLHVLGGLVFLTWIGWLSLRGGLHLTRRIPFDLCRMYWWFVVLLWLYLFKLIYIR